MATLSMRAFSEAMDEFETALYLDRRYENHSNTKAVESAKRVNAASDALVELVANQRKEIADLSSQLNHLKAERTPG